jgi:hypothetical protein
MGSSSLLQKLLSSVGLKPPYITLIQTQVFTAVYFAFPLDYTLSLLAVSLRSVLL